MLSSLIFYSALVLGILVTGASFFPIPGIGILISGYAALAEDFPTLLGLILLVVIAMVIGDILTFFLARRISKKAKKFLRKFKWYYKNENKIKKHLKKNTFKWVFLSRFIVLGASPTTNYLCGFEGIKFKKFIFPEILGTIVFASEYTLIGFIFEETWRNLIKVASLSILSIIAISIIAYFVGRKIRKERRKNKKDKRY